MKCPAMRRMLAMCVMLLIPACSTPLERVVLLREAENDRHWVFTRAGLIYEEHFLSPHGDLHVAIRYSGGVRHAQMDKPQEERELNVASQVTVYLPNRKVLSKTAFIGAEAQGKDLVWFDNGRPAREAYYAKGQPVGTWRFYDRKGNTIGEGTYISGKRFRGVFVGGEQPGCDFFYSLHPPEKVTYKDGEKTSTEELALEDFFRTN